MKLLPLLSTVLSLLAATSAHAYDATWDGNHAEAKSEAWTWGGHLQELNPDGSLGHKGLGYLYYYTRNDTSGSMIGTLNFRSSARTATVDGVGKSFQTSTIYGAKYPGSQMRARTGTLEIQFNAGANIHDHVLASAMTNADAATLARTLKLYPGLSVAPGFTPKKTHLQATETDGTVVDLTFYSIWPVLSAAGGQIEFLGQDGTYSFSEPMLVTVGSVGGKKMAGMSFLDRQWAADYFGNHMLNGLGDLLKYAKAMNYGHQWSAFHAQNQRTGEWSFFHIWHQYDRNDASHDTQIEYSGMMYMKNGTETGHVASSDYNWLSTGFIKEEGSKVMMDYALGRTGFFPTKGTFSAPKIGLQATLYAPPISQSLQQPIYFYEGYAEGEGTWNGDKIVMHGRLESSRLMFRSQDYQDMLDALAQEKGVWKQPELASWLKDNLNEDDNSLFQQLHNKMVGFASSMSEMDLKVAIFGDILSGNKPYVDPNDAGVMIYR